MRSSDNHIKYLCMSLFCQEEYQDKLLDRGIGCFLKLPDIKKRILGYQLSISQERGEHVRLGLFTPSVHCRKVSATADRFFTSFFSNASFPTMERPAKFWERFMPFPSNAIFYGLFREQRTRFDEPKNMFKRHLSRLILNILKNDRIDGQIRVSVALYLHLILADAYSDLAPENATRLTAHFHARAQNPSPKGIPQQRLGIHRTDVIAIREEIQSGAFAWHSHWKRTCSQELKRLSTICNPIAEDNLEGFQWLSGTINRQLDIGLHSSLILWQALCLEPVDL
jgi:hypothetical protein